MKTLLLDKSGKSLFSTDDIANILSISEQSAKVSAFRYAKSGYLIRLKRDLYTLPSYLKSVTEEQLFGIANLLQTPSYISLTTALSYYEITTQQQRNFIESIALQRTRTFSIYNFEFTFTKIKKNFYTGFELKDSFFIATPAKALADAIYLASLKRYNCDFEAIDFKKIKKIKVEKYLVNTNNRTKLYWENLCKTYKI